MSMTIGASQSYGGYYGIQTQTGSVKNPGESEVTAPGRKSSPAECETCKERKYQDGSDEMVSYKSASHISPSASASAVRAHEQEHVSNAFKKAATDGGKVLQASVSLKTAICPECGTSYVAGGETTTKISYTNEENPYQKQDRTLILPANYLGRQCRNETDKIFCCFKGRCQTAASRKI